MIKWLKDSKFLTSLLMIVPMVLIATINLIDIKKIIVTERMKQPQQQVQTVFKLIEHFHDAEVSKKLSRDDAQQQALSIIKKLSYNDNDYFWVNDINGVMLMHPFRSELTNKNILGIKDKDGVRVFSQMLNVINTKGEGFIYYNWPKPNSSAEVAKISFVRKFEPWGWIIGTGVYRSDIDELFYRLSIDNVLIGIFIFTLFLFLQSLLFRIENKKRET